MNTETVTKTFRGLGIFALLLLISCDGDSGESAANVALVVKEGSYYVGKLSLHPDQFAQLDERYQTPERCTNQSAATRCTVRLHDFAPVRCQLRTETGLEVLEAQATAEEPGKTTALVFGGCIQQILCGFAQKDLSGQSAKRGMEYFASTHEVALADNPSNRCGGSRSKITCETTRSGCDTDGIDCTYTLSCRHEAA